MKILIVDDEAAVATTLKAILEFEGYEVTTCSSGEKALDYCEVHVPDLIVTDNRMTGISGLEMVKILAKRQHPSKVIMMSAYFDDQNQAEALSAGALAFYRKPLDIDHFIDRLKALATTREMKQTEADAAPQENA